MSAATLVESAHVVTPVNFPAKLRPLFESHRYKVLKGGRGGGKSWSIARALLALGAKRPLRILCTREIQKSIRDSVHKLLGDQIALLALGAFYSILDNEIRGKNGTLFIFAGLQDHTIESIKSFEGIDIVWAEEAQKISKRSWDILIPTIRKDGSEIWLSFNPELDTDETYVRFVLSSPPDTVLIEMNYSDNPWHNAVLEAERVHCQRTSPDEYENIWLGKPRTVVAGAIYAKEVQAMIAEGRYGPCPYDPRLKVHTVWDMGWNDAMAIALVQRSLSECRIIAYYEGSYRTTDKWATEVLNPLHLNWGWDWLPHDAYSGDRRSGTNDAAILQACGRRVRMTKEQSIPNLDPEIGIRVARQLLAKTYLNKGGVGTDRLLECLKRYRRVIPKSTNEPASPLHDEYSHGADVIRYVALAINQMTNEVQAHTPHVPPYRPFDPSMGALG